MGFCPRRKALRAMARVMAAFLWLTAFAPSLTATSLPPTEDGLKTLRSLRADFMGVDRAGYLWTWDWPSGRFDLYDTRGSRVASTRMEGAIAVDADREWGVLGIVADGYQLRVAAWAGEKAISIPLPNRAGSAAWIGPTTVAVAPALAGHRVEIWNLTDKTLTRTMGTEKPLVPGPGLNLLRTVALHFDTERRLLYTIDAFSGAIEVYNVEGRLVRSQAGPEVHRPEIDEWIRRVGKEARDKEATQNVSLWWFRPSVDAIGTVWMVQSCDHEKHTATLFKVPPSGPPETLSFEEPCCTRSLVVWSGWALMYDKTAAPPSACNGLRRMS